MGVDATQGPGQGLARQAGAEQYGADALDGFALEDVNAHVTGPQEMAASGHGTWQYTVCFARVHEAAGMIERYAVELYADDGSVASCMCEVEENALPPGEDDGNTPDAAAQTVPDVPAEVISLAREALAQRYGLTQAQQDAMTLHTDWLGTGFAGEKPV